jgi:hypothetical protein
MNIRGLAVAGRSYPGNPTSLAVATFFRWASRLALSSMGIGGLGHLGVQFAVKMGFKTVAISCASGMHGASSAKIRTRPRRTFSTTTTG